MSGRDVPGSRFFGEPWPSGLCDTATRTTTPVGESCAHCQEPIADTDQGSFIGTMNGPAPVHRECSLRAVLGGIEHLSAGPHAEGTCYEGTTLSYRESALAAWDWIQRNRAGRPTSDRQPS